MTKSLLLHIIITYKKGTGLWIQYIGIPMLLTLKQIWTRYFNYEAVLHNFPLLQKHYWHLRENSANVESSYGEI